MGRQREIPSAGVKDEDSDSDSELVIKKGSAANAKNAAEWGENATKEEAKTHGFPSMTAEADEGPTRVLVANLSYDIDEEKLKKAFSSCGQLVDIQWMFEKGTQKFYGKVFVTFDTSVGAVSGFLCALFHSCIPP